MVLNLTDSGSKSDRSLRSLLRSRAGFTLVEILTALVVIAVLGAIVAYPFISGMNYLGKGTARTDAQAVARQAVDTLARTLASAMEVYLAPEDPTIIAYVNAQAGVVPPRPETTVVRYWQVLRSSDPNYPPNTPISETLLRPTSPRCWYDKFSSRDRDNRATAADTDSRFIARTEFTTDPNAASSDRYVYGISDPNALSRAVPASASLADPTAKSISDTQNFIAVTPSSPGFDVPFLRFALVREATPTSPPLLQISVTVSRRDSKSGQPQDVHLERVVELKNVLH